MTAFKYQDPFPVLKDDTPETLLNRIHEKEHLIYPLTIKLLSQGKVRVTNRRVYIDA